MQVTVTMMSPDAGQQSPYPIVSFDLQVCYNTAHPARTMMFPSVLYVAPLDAQTSMAIHTSTIIST
jgi:hypothetical protein